MSQIITPLLGRYNVYNVLAAVAVGIALDLSLHVRIRSPCIGLPDHVANLSKNRGSVRDSNVQPLQLGHVQPQLAEPRAYSTTRPQNGRPV